MSSWKTNPRQATTFLSRKQQWRKACGADARRPRPLPSNNEPQIAKTGQGTEGRMNARGQLRKMGQGNLELDSPVDRKTGRRSSQQELSPQRTSRRTCSVSSSGGDGDRILKRRVSFHASVEVVLVPTRHELKSKELGEDVAGEPGHKNDSDNGIWWTVSDCFGFRKAYRRQLIASGVKCTSLLCPTSVVFLIGAEDDDEDVGNEEKSSCEVREVRHSRRNKSSNGTGTPKGRRRRQKHVMPRETPPRPAFPWDMWGNSSSASFMDDI